MKILLLNSLLLFSIVGFSQSTITGKVAAADGKAIPFSNVLLLSSSDTAFVKGAVANEAGEYVLERINQGNYILQYTAVGYKPAQSAAFELTPADRNKNLGTTVIQEDVRQLNEVTIAAEKPLFQQEIDRTVVNVQSSVLTRGSTVLQVLERSPGVYVNRENNNIVLNGKTGVMVMQNGKLMRMSSQQIIALLSGTNADNVEKIELLTTPPAGYDAEGSAGMINIVFKRSGEEGTKGSASVTGGYGVGEKAVASLNLTHRTNKIDIYGSYSFSHDKSATKSFDTGYFNGAAMGETTFDFHRNSDFLSNYHNATLGYDAKLNAKTTIGNSVTYNYSKSTSDIRYNADYIILPDSFLLMKANLAGPNQWDNIITNFYIEKQLGEGEKLNLDFDYLYYLNDSRTSIDASFSDEGSNEVTPSGGLAAPAQRTIAKTPIKVGVAKADYTRLLGQKVKFEGGIKGTYTTTSNKTRIESRQGDEWVSSLTSNSVDMVEKIAAGYASFNTQLKPTASLVIGARYEYSQTELDAEVDENDVNRTISKVFPSVFYSNKITQTSEFQISYTERISRPTYNDLASYIVYNDPNTVLIGNPSLKPVLTKNLKFAYNFREYSVGLLLSRDKNPISRWQLITSPERDLFYVTPLNLQYQNNIDIQVSIPFHVGNWWRAYNGFNGGWRSYKLDHTEEKVEHSYFAYSFNSSQTFTLPKSYYLEISGWYASPGYNGTVKSVGVGMLNAGIKKDLKKNKGSIQLSVSDVLGTLKFGNQYGYVANDIFGLESRTRFQTESSISPIIRISYSRSFGKSSVKDAGQRSGGSRDERDRIRRD